MYDIHTHLYWKSYDADRDAVIARACEAGVEKMFVIGTTVEESRQAVALAEQYPELYASVGIHPHTFNDLGVSGLGSWIGELKKLAQSSKKVIAVGECGLDYYSHDKQKVISDEQKTAQQEGFDAQIELASELGLPLIVHCRPARNDSQAKRSDSGGDAYEDMFDILNTEGSKLKATVLHCYMGDTEITREFLVLPNVYFSFAGNITYPVKQEIQGTKHDIRETVRLVPLNRIFAETDCPFLAPQEHRGERNEPAFVSGIAEKISILKNVSLNELHDNMEMSFGRVFPR